MNAAAKNEPMDAGVIGRWDITVADGALQYPSWLEIRKSGHKTLVGSYVGRFGSARPIAKIEQRGAEFEFSVPPQWEQCETNFVFRGRLDGELLRGESTNESGAAVTWVGRRAPSLLHAPPEKWAKPIELFNGRDLSGWKPQFPDQKQTWLVRDGLLVNSETGNNLVSEQKFRDFQLVAEFRYPPGSNSGIYLRGRYEIQILDNPGAEPDSHQIGGIYGCVTPCANAALAADEWQRYEITLIGRRVTIVFNGQRIIDRQIIPGITGGALDSDEGSPGPILLQGDHGPIDFRKLTLTPMAE